MTTTPAPAATATIHDLVPMAHVVDVDRSIRFYAHLGFAVDHSMSDPGGTFWAMLNAGRARLMLTRASGPIDPTQQAVLFYLYTTDLPSLRGVLRSAGLRSAGEFCGAPMLGNGGGAFSTITFPHYMPRGEMRVEDPDGYCLLVGQLS